MKGNNLKYHIYFLSWLVWHLVCIACRSIISAPSGKLLYQTFSKQHFIGLGWQYYSFKTLRARKKNIDATESTFAIHDQYHFNLKLGSDNLLLRSVTVNLNSQPYMESLKWPALILSHCFALAAPLWETALRDMQDLHTADSLEEHASDQVNVIFLGFLCEIEGGFAEENPWATEKTTSHPFFRYIVKHFVINSSEIPIHR